jgi:hypothetical protein
MGHETMLCRESLTLIKKMILMFSSQIPTVILPIVQYCFIDLQLKLSTHINSQDTHKMERKYVLNDNEDKRQR